MEKIRIRDGKIRIQINIPNALIFAILSNFDFPMKGKLARAKSVL